MASALLSGAVFGAALTASGVYHPSAIVGQLKLEDWHMLETFLTATASSTFLITLSQATGQSKLSPRCYASLGLFSCLDGNLVGGALLGAGMALSGACPGTVLAQVGAGLPTGLPALGGALAAGLVWSGFLRGWTARRCTRAAAAEVGGREKGEKAGGDRPKTTLYACLGTSDKAAAAAFEACLVAAVTALTLLTPRGPAARLVSPVAGGLLIGGAQLLSLLLRRTTLGVSTGYEQGWDLLGWLLAPGPQGPPSSRPPAPTTSSLVFGAGVAAGAWALSTALPTVLDVPAVMAPPSAAQSALGGFLAVLGARLAGGCTSGHGISGMSLLSVSSFVTIASALVAGAVTARVFL